MTEKSNSEEKVIISILGESTVGKTSIIKKFINNSFDSEMLPTIGIDFYTRKLTLLKGEEKKIVIYDTSGQEQYHSISSSMIRKAEGILLVYDITKQKTFDILIEWVNKIREIREKDFPIVLIGNKCDLEEERVINKDEGEKFARENEIEFYETSCKDGTNIENSILILIYKIIEKQKIQRLKQLEEEEKEKQEGKVKNQSKKGFRLNDKKKNKNKKKRHCFKG